MESSISVMDAIAKKIKPIEIVLAVETFRLTAFTSKYPQ